MPWYSVRCLFEQARSIYEERVCLWEAESFDSAIALAEQEAAIYANGLGARYLGLAQAYALPDPPGSTVEVFSLLRESDLPPLDYLTRFFDTGRERQQHTE